MKTVHFFPWAQPTSALGYGTTSFMSADTTRERMDLLAEAYDCGIRHFDTAAYYGYGEAERLLGNFIENRRDKVTLTTKFGIEPSGIVKARWINLLARKVLKAAPFVKKIIARKRSAGATWGIFDPEKAAHSLDRSLVALRSDYIDLFLLHEPTLEGATSAPLVEYLESEVKRGRIRAYGCGGEAPAIAAVVEADAPTSRWLQFEDNALSRNLERIGAKGAKCITFAPFNRALASLKSWLDTNQTERSQWERALDLDLTDPPVLSSLLQAASHVRNKDGIVLFSSRRRERIRMAAEVAGGKRFSDSQVASFLDLTASLGSRPPARP